MTSNPSKSGTSNAEPIICSNCGHDNVSTATICIVCDAPLNRESGKVSSPPKVPGLLNHIDQDKKEAETVGNGLKCADCGHINKVGEVFCDECGGALVATNKKDATADITQQMPAIKFDEIAEKPPVEPPPTTTPKTGKITQEDDIPVGCFQFTGVMLLRLIHVESQRYMELMPDKDKPLLIGRSHDSLAVQPDVDLSPYLGELHGVSRRHALLRLRDLRLELQDLNSTNGTGINGFRFKAKETHELRNGDIITLGRTRLRVSFERKVSKNGEKVTDLLD